MEAPCQHPRSKAPHLSFGDGVMNASQSLGGTLVPSSWPCNSAWKLCVANHQVTWSPWRLPGHLVYAMKTKP